MSRMTTPVAIGLALLLPFTTGCILDKFRDKNPPPSTAAIDRKPDAASLVNYLNQNAQRVQSVRAKVDIDCKQGRQAVGLGGRMACQKPRDFRIKADVLGKPAVDIGSNNDEFWYWISQATPPYVYHCAYTDLSTGKVNLPFPFHPDLVVAALGMAEYDPEARYELRETARTVEMVQDSTSTSGEKVKRITVFNRFQAKPGEPQILGHVLQDSNGKPICRATVHKVTVDRSSGAIIPSSVTIEWPAQELSMKLYLTDIQTNALDKGISARLFQRTDLTGHDSFDLARGVVDTAGGMRRAGASAPAGR